MKNIPINGIHYNTTLKYFHDNLCNDFANRILQSGSHESNPLTISGFYNQASSEIEIIPNHSIDILISHVNENQRQIKF